MPAMSTSLTEFSTIGDKRVYTLTGHTVSKPKIVMNKRVVPTGNKTNSVFECSVIYATEDAEGNVLQQRPSFVATVTQPIQGDTADVTAMLAIFRDIIAGDEFANSVATGEFLG